MKKILIATTNPGKFHEITSEFADLDFEFVNLHDVHLDREELDEPYLTTRENALHKAEYYAKKSKLLTIAEDTGLFIRALDGAPGVKTKRFGATTHERLQNTLKALKKIPASKRQAYFETHLCLFDPATNQCNFFKGTVNGLIASKLNKKVIRAGMDYDALFYYPPAKKLFVQMSPLEKNLISHRGQVVIAAKVFLQRQFSFKQIIVPVALIVQNRKMLMTLRRDARAEFNNRWEFPGGGVENSEEIETALLRESKEETGYNLKIVERLPKILSITSGNKDTSYQVFLVGYVCTVRSGTFKTSDHETAGHEWFAYAQAIKQKLLPLNKKLIEAHKEILKKYID